MTKISMPNKPGDFEVDGVSIIILPDKIIVDTGNRQTGGTRNVQNKSAYAGKKKSDDNGGKKKKEPTLWETVLENSQNIVMGKTKL